MAARRWVKNGIARQATLSGVLLVGGYVGLFALLQSPALWYPLRPDPARSLAPDVFKPVNALFSDWWVNLERTDESAVLTVPVYLAVLALATIPVVYLLSRLSRSSVLNDRQRGQLLRRVLGATAAVMLVLLFLRGLLSTDLYSYIWYARIWVMHGSSPFTHAPSEFPPDPDGAIHWAGWQDETSVYGPAWLIISGGAFQAGEILGGSFAAQVLVFKLLANGAHLLNAWLVWSIVGLHVARGGRGGERASQIQAMALVFYAWNPLLLIEFAGSGHNDVVMLSFVLLSAWLHLKGWWAPAAVSLAVAVLTKLPAIIFVPGYLWLLLWERANAKEGEPGAGRMGAGVWRAIGALGLMAGTAVLLYWPFWEGTGTVAALVSGPANRLFLHSIASDLWWNLPSLLTRGLGINGEAEAFTEAVWQFLDRYLRLILLGVFAGVAFAVTWRARTFGRAIEAWGWVAIAAIVTQGWFWPWYVAWAVVPAALGGSRRLRTATVIFSLSALLLYVEEQVLSHRLAVFREWSGALVMGPPLAYVLFSWLYGTMRDRRGGTFGRPGAAVGSRGQVAEPERVTRY